VERSRFDLRRVILIQLNLSYTEIGHNRNLYLAERVDIPENPNFIYLYVTETACNGNKLRYLAFVL